MFIERKLLKNLDFVFLVVLLLILAVSALVIASASRSVIPSQPLYYFKKHVLWIAVGLAAMSGVLGINYAPSGSQAEMDLWVDAFSLDRCFDSLVSVR
ncbi:MAG: hypothetical protein ACOX37_10645 [Bacillota bacterium]